MFKKLMIAAAVVAVALGSAGTSQAKTVNQSDVVDPYTSLCHRTNSASNPYSSVPFSKSYTEIDGQGNNDHTLHTGPVATSRQVALALKKNHQDWGDIIPPVPSIGFAGYNWTTEGQEVYNHQCGVTDDDDVATEPFIEYTVVCDTTNPAAPKVVVTVTNNGTATGSVIVNDEVIELHPDETTTRDFLVNTKITIVINEETVYDQVATCDLPEGGSGGGSTTTTPATPATPLVAAGGAHGAAALSLLGLTGSLSALGYGILKFRKVS